MATADQIKTIRKLSGLSRKKKLKPLTADRAKEIIKALSYDEAAFVELESGQTFKLRPLYPRGRRRRRRL